MRLSEVLSWQWLFSAAGSFLWHFDDAARNLFILILCALWKWQLHSGQYAEGPPVITRRDAGAGCLPWRTFEARRFCLRSWPEFNSVARSRCGRGPGRSLPMVFTLVFVTLSAFFAINSRGFPSLHPAAARSLCLGCSYSFAVLPCTAGRKNVGGQIWRGIPTL